MDHIPRNDILQTSIDLYEMIGEKMYYSPTNLTFLFRIWNFFVLCLHVLVSVISFIHAQSETYVKSVEGGATALHCLVNYFCFVYYKHDIEYILSEMKGYWDYQNAVPKLRNSINNIHISVKRIQKIILISTSIVMISFWLRPIVNNKIKFIFYFYISIDSIILETLVLFIQYYFVVIIVPVIFACDSLYLSLSVHVISQLRLLNYKLRKMEMNVSDQELYAYVKYHQFMLSVYDRIKRVFYLMLLFHYFVTLISGCSQLYVIIAGNAEPIDLVTSALYLMAILIQFAYYAFPMEYIVSELSYMSTAIYMSPWLEKGINQKKIFIFIMMRVRQQKYLSIGGIMDMNVDAFGSVVRKMFSFCAILRNVLTET